MLIIHCPFCGPRDECEFSYGGPAKQRRPDEAAEWSEESWRNHLLVPENPMGDVEERWWHAKGCGLWLTLKRNTLTHEVTSSVAEVASKSAIDLDQDDSP